MRVKRSILAVIILALVGAIAIFAGCDVQPEQPGEDALQPFRDAYAKVVSAKEIEQQIEITQNSLLVYGRERKYVKTDGQYSVETTQKQLNGDLITAEEAYTVTTESGTAPATEFASKLNLTQDYLQEVTAESTKLTAKVKAGNERDVFSITELAGVSDMSITLTATAGNLTGLTANYTATKDQKTYAVSITISFEY